MLLLSSFFFFSCIDRHHSSWLLTYVSAIALKAAAESDVDLTCILFSQLFTFSDPLQVLQSLLMNGRIESDVLDEGDGAGVPQDRF